MKKTTWAGLLVGFSVFGVAIPSFADGPATAGVVQLGVGFRYGANLNDGDSNPWASGLGIQGGYTLPVVPVYIGGNAEYFFGNSIESQGIKVDSHLWQLSAEAGYDVGIGSAFVIRPKLGLGIANSSAKVCLDSGCSEATSSDPLIAPGATFLLLTSHFKLSLDTRYEVVFADQKGKAFIFSVGIGF